MNYQDDELSGDERRAMILLHALSHLRLGEGSPDNDGNGLGDKSGETSRLSNATSTPTPAISAIPIDNETDNKKKTIQAASTCEAAVTLEGHIRSGDAHISTWVESHRRASEEDPDRHRSCHRLVWRAVSVLEEMEKPRDSTTDDEIISLVREVYSLSGPQQLNYLLAGRKLIGLLRSRSGLATPARSDLEEIVSIRRGILKRGHEVGELGDLEDLLDALRMLCDEYPEASSLEERVALGRQALYEKPGDVKIISDLAAALYALYDRTSDSECLREFSALETEKLQREKGIDCAVMSGMQDQFQRRRQLDNVPGWLALHGRMVTLAPDTHATCPERLVSLLAVFRASKQSSQIDAVAIAQEAVHLTNLGIGVSQHLRALNELARTLNIFRQADYLDEAAKLHERIYQLVRGSTYHIRSLGRLPRNSITGRSQSPASRPKDTSCDLSEAERNWKTALAFDAIAETAGDSMPMLRWVNPFRAAHLDLTRPPDLMEDFQAAFRSQIVSEAAFEAMPPNSPQRAQALITNAHVLLTSNEPSHLDAAVAFSMQSAQCLGGIPETNQPPNHPVWATLRTLSHALYMRYQSYGSLDDLKQSVAILLRCLEGVEEVPARLSYLYPLGSALEALFRRLGRRELIEGSLACFRESLAKIPNEPGIRVIILYGLGKALHSYYDDYGGIAVLDEAAWVVREALRHCPTSHPLTPSLLASLGGILGKRYVLLQAFNDLKAALDLGNAAIRISKASGGTDADFPTYAARLGESTLLLFEERRNTEDLETAIALFRQALELREDVHPERADCLFRLGMALRQRYMVSSENSDITMAIDFSRQALKAQPDIQHPRHPFWTAGLAAALLIQAQREKTPYLLDEAAELYESALTLIPVTHPGRADVLASFGETLYTRFETQGNSSDLDRCLKMYAEAASSTAAPNSRCLHHTRTWEDLAIKHKHPSIEDAFDASFQHKFRMVNLGRTVQSRHEMLADAPINSSRAAAHAISEGKLERAVEILEQGRSIVWQQTLYLRSSMDALHQASPSLAAQLSATVAELDSISRVQSVSYHSSTMWSITDPDRTARHNRELAEKYESLLADVRKLDGFQNFMKHTTFADLDGIGSDGPVVLVNICEDRCDAILLTSSAGLRHVPLPNAIWADYETAQEDLDSAAEFIEENPSAGSVANMDSVLLRTLRMLWSTTVNPIVEELRTLGPMPQRMFWCMAGSTELPIHAAGPYVDGCLNLPDIVASSYTPTLMALLRARKPVFSDPNQSLAILAVAQTSTPGFCTLPGAEVEVEHLQKSSPIPVKQLIDADATSSAVLEGLKEHNWAHLSCHGTVDPHQPLLSAFHLHQGTLNIESLMRAALPAADFIFLAACHTALGSIARNESMSLAVAVQVAGFRSIIATMYSIGDDDSPIVAKEVYSYLFRDPERPPTSSDAAVALNKATVVLRRIGVPLFRWVPFIHIGL